MSPLKYAQLNLVASEMSQGKITFLSDEISNKISLIKTTTCTRGIFQVIWGRFSRHNIHVTSEKRGRGEEKKEGEGKKKAVQGREESIFKGAGEGFQQCYVLKTFPSTLKNEGKGEKRGEMGRKICTGKGREYFQMYWGRFSFQTFPSTLKIE